MTSSRAREWGVVAAVWRSKGLWAIHLIANATLLFLIYEWLAIPDRTVLHLVLSALSALAIIALALSLHGGTLAHFIETDSGEPLKLRETLRLPVGRLLAFAVWSGVLVLLVYLALQLHDYRDAAANWTSSWLTLNLRRPVSPGTMSSLFWWGINLLAVVVIPILLLPWGCRMARYGFSGFTWSNLKASCRTVRRTRYWLAYAALFIFGVVVPYKLVWWIPEVNGLYPETASLVARLGVSYVIAVTAWLLLAATVGTWNRAE